MAVAISSRKAKEYSEKIKLIPEIVTEVARHEKKQQEQEKKIQEHDEILVIGNPKENEPSLLERIRNIERKMAGAEFWLKTIAVLFVTQIVLDFVNR